MFSSGTSWVSVGEYRNYFTVKVNKITFIKRNTRNKLLLVLPFLKEIKEAIAIGTNNSNSFILANIKLASIESRTNAVDFSSLSTVLIYVINVQKR
ncbi:hypothetical protein SAMN02745196_01996 [Clostridium collagenovorans DSM 3089]|uniref:Uncharacterized protein n=1 Tax=Clostridium collagenovorans DSM 3089 TaxID=1121306 RepID=A0A1M5X5E5_9CLOT|nr:hypothetical protein [Clostridium collagenovorans]SHH94714.1 hypothetical protein SAMN02745196_01996 [Clostridium collagenovorans DSM 3089]